MNSTQPLVSICTPCYNHARYLKDYFESIINQTYKNIELIIIDDVSPDDSVKIIKEYMPLLKKRFVRVHFEVNEKNLGVVSNVNRTINMMRGKYCKLLASDDMLEKSFVEKMVNYLEANPEIGISISNMYHVPDDYRLGGHLTCKCKKNYSRDISEYLKDSDKLFEMLLDRNLIAGPGTLIRSSIYKKYGVFDERMKFEDYEFWLRICKTEKMGYIDECLVYYRNSATSLSRNEKGNKEKYEKIMVATMQPKIKHGRKLGEKKYKEFLKKKFSEEIENSIKYGYTDIAIKLYNTATRLDIKMEQSLSHIVCESIRRKCSG